MQHTKNKWTLNCILNTRVATLASLTWLPLTHVFYWPSNPFTGGFRIFHYITLPRAKFFIEFCFQYFFLLGLRCRCLVHFFSLLLILLSVRVLSHLEESVVFCFVVASIGIPTFMGGLFEKSQYLHWYFFIILDGFYVSGSQLINMSLKDKLWSLNYVDYSPDSSSYNTILPKTFFSSIVPKEDFISFFIRFIVRLYFRIVLLSIWQQPVEYWTYFPCIHDLSRQ